MKKLQFLDSGKEETIKCFNINTKRQIVPLEYKAAFAEPRGGTSG